MNHDVLAIADEPVSGTPLLKPAMRTGRLVLRDTLADLQARAAAGLRALPQALRGARTGPPGAVRGGRLGSAGAADSGGARPRRIDRAHADRPARDDLVVGPEQVVHPGDGRLAADR
jgi:hypothetical protein